MKTKKAESIGLHFGLLCEPLAKQLADQGHAIPKRNGVILQKFADAISLLAVHGMLSDAEKDRVRKRLLQRIIKGLQFSAGSGE